MRRPHPDGHAGAAGAVEPHRVQPRHEPGHGRRRRDRGPPAPAHGAALGGDGNFFPIIAQTKAISPTLAEIRQEVAEAGPGHDQVNDQVNDQAGNAGAAALRDDPCLYRARPRYLRRGVHPAGPVARGPDVPDTVTMVGTARGARGALVLYPMGQLWWGTAVHHRFIFSDVIDGMMARDAATRRPLGQLPGLHPRPRGGRCPPCRGHDVVFTGGANPPSPSPPRVPRAGQGGVLRTGQGRVAGLPRERGHRRTRPSGWWGPDGHRPAPGRA